MYKIVYSVGGFTIRNIHITSMQRISHFEPLYHKIKLIFLTLLSTLKFDSTKFYRWADWIQEKNAYFLYECFIFKH